MSSRVIFDPEKAGEAMRAGGSAYVGSQIKIVKPVAGRVNSARREELLKNIDYLETQIGRLAKMARDLRAEFLLLTVE